MESLVTLARMANNKGKSNWLFRFITKGCTPLLCVNFRALILTHDSSFTIGDVGKTGSVGPRGPPGPPGVKGKGLAGVKYVRWGRTNCSEDATVVYNGKKTLSFYLPSLVEQCILRLSVLLNIIRKSYINIKTSDTFIAKTSI